MSQYIQTLWSRQAVGEPPLFLAASVFHAIRYAIRAANSDTRNAISNKSSNYNIDTSAKNENFISDDNAASCSCSSRGKGMAKLEMDSPATAARIRMACNDVITSQVRLIRLKKHILLLVKVCSLYCYTNHTITMPLRLVPIKCVLQFNAFHIILFPKWGHRVVLGQYDLFSDRITRGHLA